MISFSFLFISRTALSAGGSREIGTDYTAVNISVSMGIYMYMNERRASQSEKLGILESSVVMGFNGLVVVNYVSLKRVLSD